MDCLHIITGLNDGGAEAVLYRLCHHDQANQHHVVSLSGSGKYGPMLEALGVLVTTLNMSPGRPSPLAFIRLVRLMRREKPDVVQTWMYHGDLFGGLAARAAGIPSVVWGIRHTTLEGREIEENHHLDREAFSKTILVVAGKDRGVCAAGDGCA